MRKAWTLGIISMFLIVGCINTVYYITTRDTLIKNQQEQIKLNVDNIHSSIETTKEADLYFNRMISEQLRSSSIAIQNKLPKDYQDVKDADLKSLAKNLGLEGITLFAQKGDDIIGVKSTNPEEIGLSTKGWAKGKWYNMFHQLLVDHDVTLIPRFGEKLEHFWAGPVDTSSADPTKIRKWGYYNDGTTNYLIDPYVGNTTLADFNKKAGVDHSIQNTIKRSEYLLEIGVLNSEALLNGEKKTRDTGIVWYSDKLVIYGGHTYTSPKDKTYVKRALVTNEPEDAIFSIDEMNVMKTYVPLEFTHGDNVNDRLVMIVTSDYEKIQSELTNSTLRILLISGLCSIIALTIFYFIIHILKKKEKTIRDVQDLYSQNIDRLFTTVKEYRHDFNHHLFTIQGLANLKKYDELAEYVQHISDVQTNLNDIIDVNIPALSGLLQAKIAEAGEKGIQFEHHFERFQQTKLDMKKVTNLVRVVGNILDNAFHAVGDNSKERKVTITGNYQSGFITISVYNNGDQIPPEHLAKIFEEGFSTRLGRGGSGIGLASSRKIMEGYKGQIEVKSEADWTVFTVRLPISTKEIVSKKTIFAKNGGRYAS